MRPALAALLLLTALLGGCGGNDSTTEPPDTGILRAETPEELLWVFEQALISRDWTGYAAWLDDRYVFGLSDGGTLSRAEDVASTANMLSGEARTNSQGELTRAVTGLDLTLTGPATAWEDAAPGDPFTAGATDARTATYRARLILTHAVGTITVDGDLVFYAVPDSSSSTAGWGLIAVVDPGKATQQTSWSELKIMYH